MKYFKWQWWLDYQRDAEKFKYERLHDVRLIKREFQQLKLSPGWRCLKYNWESFKNWGSTFKSFNDQLPKQLTSIDLESFRLRYSELEVDKTPMYFSQWGRELLAPIYYEGLEMKDHLVDQFSLEPIGVEPIYKKEGYYLLCNGDKKELSAYRFSFQGVNDRKDRTHISTSFSGCFTLGFSNTAWSIKKELLQQEKLTSVLPVYLIHSEMVLPQQETFNPLAKRKLVSYLSTGV